MQVKSKTASQFCARRLSGKVPSGYEKTCLNPPASGRRVGCGPVDLPDSCEVPAALEFRLQPDANDAEGLDVADRTLAEREDIAVVVRPVPDRELLVPAQAAADAAHAI